MSVVCSAHPSAANEDALAVAGIISKMPLIGQGDVKPVCIYQSMASIRNLELSQWHKDCQLYNIPRV